MVVINLRVKTIDGHDSTIDIEDEATLAPLREVIHQKTGIDQAQQRIIFHGRVLTNDSATLRELGLGDGMALHVVSRPPQHQQQEAGGMGRARAQSPPPAATQQQHHVITQNSFVVQIPMERTALFAEPGQAMSVIGNILHQIQGVFPLNAHHSLVSNQPQQEDFSINVRFRGHPQQCVNSPARERFEALRNQLRRLAWLVIIVKARFVELVDNIISGSVEPEREQAYRRVAGILNAMNAFDHFEEGRIQEQIYQWEEGNGDHELNALAEQLGQMQLPNDDVHTQQIDQLITIRHCTTDDLSTLLYALTVIESKILQHLSFRYRQVLCFNHHLFQNYSYTGRVLQCFTTAMVRINHLLGHLYHLTSEFAMFVGEHVELPQQPLAEEEQQQADQQEAEQQQQQADQQEAEQQQQQADQQEAEQQQQQADQQQRQLELRRCRRLFPQHIMPYNRHDAPAEANITLMFIHPSGRERQEDGGQDGQQQQRNSDEQPQRPQSQPQPLSSTPTTTFSSPTFNVVQQTMEVDGSDHNYANSNNVTSSTSSAAASSTANATNNTNSNATATANNNASNSQPQTAFNSMLTGIMSIAHQLMTGVGPANANANNRQNTGNPGQQRRNNNSSSSNNSNVAPSSQNQPQQQQQNVGGWQMSRPVNRGNVTILSSLARPSQQQQVQPPNPSARTFSGVAGTGMGGGGGGGTWGAFGQQNNHPNQLPAFMLPHLASVTASFGLQGGLNNQQQQQNPQILLQQQPVFPSFLSFPRLPQPPPPPSFQPPPIPSFANNPSGIPPSFMRSLSADRGRQRQAQQNQQQFVGAGMPPIRGPNAAAAGGAPQPRGIGVLIQPVSIELSPATFIGPEPPADSSLFTFDPHLPCSSRRNFVFERDADQTNFWRDPYTLELGLQPPQNSLGMADRMLTQGQTAPGNPLVRMFGRSAFGAGNGGGSGGDAPQLITDMFREHLPNQMPLNRDGIVVLTDIGQFTQFTRQLLEAIAHCMAFYDLDVTRRESAVAANRRSRVGSASGRI